MKTSCEQFLRVFRITMDDGTSSTALTSCGIPQGSVLGPILFSLYLFSPWPSYLPSVLYHFYADDSQIYISHSTLKTTITWPLCTSALLPLRTGCPKMSSSWTQTGLKNWLLVWIIFPMLSQHSHLGPLTTNAKLETWALFFRSPSQLQSTHCRSS